MWLTLSTAKSSLTPDALHGNAMQRNEYGALIRCECVIMRYRMRCDRTNLNSVLGSKSGRRDKLSNDKDPLVTSRET